MALAPIAIKLGLDTPFRDVFINNAIRDLKMNSEQPRMSERAKLDSRKAVQGRRTRLEQSVRSAACDLDLGTEKRGSPHTLIAVKNQASYERRAKQRRQDLEHVAALGG